MEIRVLAGYAFEDAGCLGVAHVTEEVIGKGTARRDGRQLNDAFDEIGATHGAFTGRESFGFSSVCLPEFLDRDIDLHAEMICTPSFPDDACRVAVELAEQSLAALADDPGELAKKMLYAQAYGEPLGRHPLGEAETLARIDRDRIVAHWHRLFVPRRMNVVIAGDVDPERLAEKIESSFAPLAENDTGASPPADATFAIQFGPNYRHLEKDVEQEQVAMCFPGSASGSDDYYVEKVAIGVLAGGMSGRLFTEVREKQGLVYWVGAWDDHPRGGGMVHVGASTTPENLEKTYETLLREINRLGEDLDQAEVDRAIAGIVTRVRTRGDVTRARASEAADDLFYYRRIVPTEQKLAKIAAVTARDIQDYLAAHPRDKISLVTLGPEALKL